MNKILLSLAALLTLTVAAHAVSPINATSSFLVPTSVNGVADVNGKWSLPKICRVDSSLTGVVCQAAGEGVVLSVEVSSGAIGGYGVVVDAASLASAAATAAATVLTTQKTCEYTVATTATNYGHCGLKQFEAGVPFTTGLSIAASTADTRMVVVYRLLRK